MTDSARTDWFVLESTPSCNLRCEFCCNPWTAEDADPPAADPKTSFRTAERIASICSIRGVTISGGEPTTGSDIPDLVRLLSRRVPEVHLATNGTLLDGRKARELADAGLAAFQISLPAALPGTYRRLCGVDAMRKALIGITAAASTGIPVSAAFPVCSVNYAEAGDALEMAFACGASSFQIIPLAPGGRATKGWPLLSPSRDQMLAAIDSTAESASKAGITAYTGIPIAPCEWDLPKCITNTGCTGAGPKWAVDPWGMVRPCEQSGLILGSFFESDFASIAGSDAATGFRNARRNSACDTCAHLPACRGGCRAFVCATAPPAAGPQPGSRV